MSVQSRLQQGELPAQQIVEGVMLAVAGGIATDSWVYDRCARDVRIAACSASHIGQAANEPSEGPGGDGVGLQCRLWRWSGL